MEYALGLKYNLEVATYGKTNWLERWWNAGECRVMRDRQRNRG